MTFNTRDAATDSVKFTSNEKGFDDRASEVGRIFRAEVTQSSSNQNIAELANHMQAATKELVTNKVLPECEVEDNSNIFQVQPNYAFGGYSDIFKVQPGCEPNVSGPEHASADAKEQTKEQPTRSEKEGTRGGGEAEGSGRDQERINGIGEELGVASGEARGKSVEEAQASGREKERNNGVGNELEVGAKELGKLGECEKHREAGDEKQASSDQKAHESNDEKQAPVPTESGKNLGHHSNGDWISPNEQRSRGNHANGDWISPNEHGSRGNHANGDWISPNEHSSRGNHANGDWISPNDRRPRRHHGHHRHAPNIVLDSASTNEAVTVPRENPPMIELD